MADYFLSDVHLRLDRPERGDRLAALVARLGPADNLTIVGDLCDFWFAARQRRSDPMSCAGLRSLAGFRDRGGSIIALAGNHDAWLGPFYERTIGAKFLPDRLERDVAGQRALIVHGHRLGARTPWKAGLESRAFLAAFAALPSFIADRLGAQLQRTNDRNHESFQRHGLDAYRNYVAAEQGCHDLVILGHVHRPLDTGPGRSRLVVLGGWIDGAAYLRVDGPIITHVVQEVEA